MHEINVGIEAVACYVTVERCQEVIEVELAMPVMVDAVRRWVTRFDVPVPDRPVRIPAESMLSGVLFAEVIWC
ncbi:MAG: hypothetical protein SD837_19780 [Candidatus Electrothrix scaldis]|nr:MAG: hypothetical protein SD837_19780 [Candidatus Electrothrix sp. GW3-3]